MALIPEGSLQAGVTHPGCPPNACLLPKTCLWAPMHVPHMDMWSLASRMKQQGGAEGDNAEVAGPRGCCRHPGRSSYMVLVGKPLPSMRVPQQAAAPLRRRGRGAKRHARTSSPSCRPPGNGPAHNFWGAKTCFGNPIYIYNGEQFGCMLQGARTHACALDTHAECGGGRTRVLQGRVLRGSPNTYYKCSLFILRASTSSPYCCSILSQARGECGRPRS